MADLARAAKALRRMARSLGIKQEPKPSTVQRDFEKEMTVLLAAYWAGTRTSLTTSDMRVIISQAIQNAYIDAIDASGTGELSAADKRAIDQLYLQQEEFVAAFVADAQGAKDNSAAQAAILGRLLLWRAAIGAVSFVAQAINAPDEMVEWRYGDTDHCDTCRRLNGQRHTRDWFYSRGYIPRQPGSTTLDCHGYRCKCELLPT